MTQTLTGVPLKVMDTRPQAVRRTTTGSRLPRGAAPRTCARMPTRTACPALVVSRHGTSRCVPGETKREGSPVKPTMRCRRSGTVTGLVNDQQTYCPDPLGNVMDPSWRQPSSVKATPAGSAATWPLGAAMAWVVAGSAEATTATEPMSARKPLRHLLPDPPMSIHRHASRASRPPFRAVRASAPAFWRRFLSSPTLGRSRIQKPR